MAVNKMKSESQASRWIKRTVAAIFLVLAIWGIFGGNLLPRLAIECQAVPAMLKHPLIAVPLFFGLTALIGRFFCESMCPLGILQSVVNRLTHPKNAVRRVCTRLPEVKAQRIVRWTVVALVAVLLAAGYGALAYAVEPYSILTRALLLYPLFAGLAVFILALAAVGDGRFWCNWICPVGTLFHLASRKAPCANGVGKGCQNCRKCFPKPANPQSKTRNAQPSEGGVTRRETVQGLALLAAAEKTTDGGLADLVAPGFASSREASVLPPGALSRLRFQRMCVACGQCIRACSTGVLKPSTDFTTFGQPQLDFHGNTCSPDCDMQCAKACPAGAIRFLDGVPRRDVHVGFAVWDSTKCLRSTEDVRCSLCARKCPVGAIHHVKGGLVVDDRLCIGCGICENACAARPEPAIVVKGLDIQSVVRPMDEAALIDEMKKLLSEGDSVVVARDGVIRGRERGRGVMPLMKLFNAERLNGALVVDRVIGRAAAAICVAGGARKVHALMMSTGAAEFLKANGVACSTDETVAEILNPAKDGMCPMEAAVKDLKDPSAMVDALRETIEKMKKR